MKTCVHNFKNNCVTDRRRIKTFLLPDLVLMFLLIAGKGWSQLSEGFEGGALPPVWTQTYVSGTQNWVYQAGAYSGAVTTAHSGNYNAMFQSTSWNDNKTMIYTPAIT